MSSVTVYTTHPCPYCSRAKALLDARGIPYEEINLASDPDGRAALVALTGLMTFPQIMIDDRTIGGYDALAAADSSGRLSELLADSDA